MQVQDIRSTVGPRNCRTYNRDDLVSVDLIIWDLLTSRLNLDAAIRPTNYPMEIGDTCYVFNFALGFDNMNLKVKLTLDIISYNAIGFFATLPELGLKHRVMR